jgi:hypothetical protein
MSRAMEIRYELREINRDLEECDSLSREHWLEQQAGALEEEFKSLTGKYPYE